MIKKFNAQITNLYSKKIGPFISDYLIIGFYNNQNFVMFAKPDQIVLNGTL